MEFLCRKICILVLIILASSLLTIRASHAASPQVRVSIDMVQEYWVGQKIPLQVQLLSPGYFSGTPKFDLPEISGVLVMKIPERPVVGTEDVEGRSFTTQLHEFALFPLKPGIVKIPPFMVRFEISGPVGEPSKDVSLKTTPLTVTPKVPPGAEKLSTIISTKNLRLAEKWEPEPKEAFTGDSFTRTVTYTAPDIPGMAFASLPEVPVPGIGIYPEEPVVNDRTDRGDFIGERTEKVTYVMESAGEMTIPAVSYQWFDIASETLKTEELPEVTFTVKPSVLDLSPEKTVTPAESYKTLFIVLIALIIIGAVIWRWRSYLIDYLKSRQEIKKASESYYFKQFTSACRKNDPRAALNELMKWVDRVNTDGETATLSEFMKMCGVAELASELDRLQNAAFKFKNDSDKGKAINWSGRKLLALMIIARKQLRKSKHNQNTMTSGLMPLNPL